MKTSVKLVDCISQVYLFWNYIQNLKQGSDYLKCGKLTLLRVKFSENAGK